MTTTRRDTSALATVERRAEPACEHGADAAGRLFVEPGRASGTVIVDHLERL